jgi:hypothetical protein
MSDLTFARVFVTLVNVLLALVCVSVYLQREIEREEGEVEALPEPPTSGYRYYSPCITCETTVFDREGNVVRILPAE